MSAGDPTAGIAAALAGSDGQAVESFGQWCVDVPSARWVGTLDDARSRHRLTYLDWLGGVDEQEGGFSVVAHLLDPRSMAHLLVRTRVPRAAPALGSATGLYPGAAWHERETAEMFGITFSAHPSPAPLLLPEEFAGHPLRKDFVLAARVAKPWPGAEDPGPSTTPARRGRRTPRPPGVPDPCGWGRDVADG